jgi:hypothetical protein
MTIGKTDDYETLTVTGSVSVARPDGGAILLKTLERGSIVFAITLQGIAGLRQSLSEVEQHIRQIENQTKN